MRNVRTIVFSWYRNLARLARSFIEFRHHYENSFEISEALMIGAVFVLLLSGREKTSEFFGTVTHLLVGILLAFKLFSWLAVRLFITYGNQHGTELEQHESPFLSLNISLAGERSLKSRSYLEPLENRYTTWITFDNPRGLREFSEMCHRLIVDRDVSFSVEHRIALYRRWLSSGVPCLLGLTTGRSNLVGGTVVLPLTREAHNQYCHGKLDALKIEAFHIETGAEARRRYLLIDILALDPAAESVSPAAIFRAAIRHIARFYNPVNQPGPVIFCSTYTKPLIKWLTAFEFQAVGVEHGTTARVYRVDLANLDIFAPKVQKRYANMIDIMKQYNQQAGVTPDGGVNEVPPVPEGVANRSGPLA